ncbi:DUF3219 family protein [Ferdinandcohnia sp. Marseille-Q9671]
MTNEIYLNDYKLKITDYKEDLHEGVLRVTVDFKVSSEDYHDVTTLLYKGKFDLKVPDRNIECKVSIEQYSTSITNLYEKDQVGDFTLSLVEVKE